jgi:hypothetical protein
MLIVAVAVVSAATVAAAVAWGAIDDGGTVHVCYSKAGKLTVIDVGAGKTCKKKEGLFDLYTKSGADAAFLGANAKAADSDKLDGIDSTGFLGVNAKAADSDKLDGADSTAFQARVTGTCSAPQAVRAIAANGGVTCVSPPPVATGLVDPAGNVGFTSGPIPIVTHPSAGTYSFTISGFGSGCPLPQLTSYYPGGALPTATLSYGGGGCGGGTITTTVFTSNSTDQYWTYMVVGVGSGGGAAQVGMRTFP